MRAGMGAQKKAQEVRPRELLLLVIAIGGLLVSLLLIRSINGNFF